MSGFASACFFGLLAVLSMIYLRAAAWFFIAGLAFSLGFSLWKWLKKEAHLEKKQRVFCSIGLVAVILLLGWALMALVPLETINKQESTIPSKSGVVSAPFHVEIPVIVKNDTSDDQLVAAMMVAYKDERGDVASPINIALFIEITNKQNFTSKMSRYSVEAADYSDGPWKPLMPISPKNSELYMVTGPDLTKVKIFSYDKDLISILRSSDFEPREPRAGWAFFECREILPSKINFIRFHLGDIAREDISTILPMPTRKRGEVQVNIPAASLRDTGKRIDISKFRFKYAHSSNPR